MRRGLIVLSIALGAGGCTASPEASSISVDATVAVPPADAGPSVFVRPDAGVECTATDLDGDGFGTGAACAVIDCDDGNALVYPDAPEACNGVDDDCDERIDEDLGEGSCGTGICARTAPFCEAGRAALCTPGVPEAAESCNLLDDDCDGDIDEDVPGDSCGVGACARSAACVGGAMQACVPGPVAPESCNRIDDNCDGVVDDGFRARVEIGSYTALSGVQPSCNAGARIGPDCNAAMHRTCAASGCTTSGFGPVENSGDTSVYTCVVAAAEATVSYAELALQHADCDGTRERIGPACNAAIHRWCAARQYATGFGPAESGADSVLVQCLSAASTRVIEVDYAVLVTHHPGCDGTTGPRRIGPDCNAAIHRFCTSQQHVSGFGPLENSGGTALVACVTR